MKMIFATGGKLRGYIQEIGDRKILLAPGGRVLGYYIRSTDITILPGGALVGFGDQLMSLLVD